MMTSQLRIAVLGTGIMGAAMARNLLRAGHDVTVWNRTAERAEPLVAAGAHRADTPAEAVAEADVVLTMLYDGPAVAAVMREAGPGLRPGTAWVQCSTVSAGDAADLAELAAGLGLHFFECPVAGTKQPAEAGTLVLLVAGPSAQRELVEPVLAAIGSRTVWVGEDSGVGAAARLKLVINAWLVMSANAAGELTALAQALGVEIPLLLEALHGGVLDEPFLRTKLGLLQSGELTPPSFAVETAGKDAHLIVAAAREHDLQLDALEGVAARFDRARALGYARADMAATYYASFPAAEAVAED